MPITHVHNSFVWTRGIGTNMCKDSLYFADICLSSSKNCFFNDFLYYKDVFKREKWFYVVFFLKKRNVDLTSIWWNSSSVQYSWFVTFLARKDTFAKKRKWWILLNSPLLYVLFNTFFFSLFRANSSAELHWVFYGFFAEIQSQNYLKIEKLLIITAKAIIAAAITVINSIKQSPFLINNYWF